MRIEAFEAKDQFSDLLEMAARGEDVTITEHGKSVAKLVAIGGGTNPSGHEVLAALRVLRKRETLGGLSLQELRDEGRK